MLFQAVRLSIKTNIELISYLTALNTIESVNKGWESIIADVISKDCDVLEFIIQL